MELKKNNASLSGLTDNVSLPRSGARVLIVEDESLVGWSLASMLQKLGSEVVVVESAECALQRLLSSEFDLVITDRELPEMDGVTLAKKIKEMAQNVIIIMTSATSGPQLCLENQLEQVDHFVEKPFNLHEMSALVLRCLSGNREKFCDKS